MTTAKPHISQLEFRLEAAAKLVAGTNEQKHELLNRVVTTLLNI
jgi:hypothetical protein